MSLGSMEQQTEGMKRQAIELIEQAYNRGFKAGQERAMEMEISKYIDKGRNEAWECIRKIEQMPTSESEPIFNQFGLHNIMNHYSATEAIEKLRAYDEQKKQDDDKHINVGDEVILNDGDKAVVTEHHSDVVCVVKHDGCTSFKSKDDIKKTGRTFPEIAEVLKKMKEGE